MPHSRDHPRVCGEKCPPGKFFFMTVGSPPRMRGKEDPSGAVARCPGITPAYAGKSAVFTLNIPGATGSPPRMRGKDLVLRSKHLEIGITPACAGKRGLRKFSSAQAQDHPRVRGEKHCTSTPIALVSGSPPRMRGKAVEMKLAGTVHGITPAYAGKGSIPHLTASLGEFEVQKGHPVPHLRQRLQVWPDHARHLRHGLILHASRSAGQGRRLCPGPCPDTAGSGTPRGPSPAKRPHTSPPAATPGGCRAWQSGATAHGSR